MDAGYRDRTYWLSKLNQIAAPVLQYTSAEQLKIMMPVEGKTDDRPLYTHLEAVARLLAGMAPWLESSSENDEESISRERFAGLARKAIDHATNPVSPDFMNFSEGNQTIVDSAFLAHAILRAPKQLWGLLEDRVKENVIQAFVQTRSHKPYFSNWLLFSAMIETFFYRVGADWDPMRIDYALRQHEQWFLGDGIYGDGPDFHADYYNSFVIHPMLLDIIDNIHEALPDLAPLRDKIASRARRHASVLERVISPEGAFPVIGRSLAYRFGAFQLLSQIALRGELEEHLDPAQVRCALTSVIRRTIEMPGTFDSEGWLTIGFCGHQPGVGENYISTGSLYLCSTVFLALGIPPEDSFWCGEEKDWTSKKAWSGQPFPIDHAH
ncbi:DUF2264 domain-containing protein [Paenibacillus sp. NPDC056579]|uniref:DUF2264 domain-containing protein n=1 Tax=Paenibacillus sp. NPDC056579 TaxID=3345871 RepID=UPI0036A6019E